MELPTLELPFAVPTSAIVRISVLEQVLQALLFTLQQCPAQIHDIRSWKKRYQDGESAYESARGKRAPKSLARKRALDFITRYDGMIAGLRSAVSSHRLLEAVIVLGPNYHNPKYAMHIDFEGCSVPLRYPANVQRILAGDSGRVSTDAVDVDEDLDIPPMAGQANRLPAVHDDGGYDDGAGPGASDMDVEGYESGGAGGGGGSGAAPRSNDRKRALATEPDRPADDTGSGSGSRSGGDAPLRQPTRPGPEAAAYSSPLSPELTAAVAKKTARLLIIEAQKVYGMRSVPPNKILLLVRTQPLEREASIGGAAASSSSSSAATAGAGDLGEEGASEAGGEAAAELPPGWHMRPTFSLKPPRLHSIRNVVKPAASPFACDRRKDDCDADEEDLMMDDLLEDEEVAPTSVHGGDQHQRRAEKTVVWGRQKYRLTSLQVIDQTVASTSSSLAAKSSGSGPGAAPPEASWWQWVAAPHGFNGGLPDPPKIPVPKQLPAET